MQNTRTARSNDERRAIVESIDLRIDSGGMTHRQATRLEGVSDALVHSWRRKLNGTNHAAGKHAAAPRKPEPAAVETHVTAAMLPVPEADVEHAAALVKALRAGGSAVLQFDGKTWQLRVR